LTFRVSPRSRDEISHGFSDEPAARKLNSKNNLLIFKVYFTLLDMMAIVGIDFAEPPVPWVSIAILSRQPPWWNRERRY
jgi:hypothetical protein